MMYVLQKRQAGMGIVFEALYGNQRIKETRIHCGRHTQCQDQERKGPDPVG